jgi:hypothetical protein
MSSLVLYLAALGTFASYVSAFVQATPAATPSTITLTLTILPSTSGGPTSYETEIITLNPTPNGGPAFTAPPSGMSPEPAVPGDDPPCSSLDELVSSCTTLSSFYGLPLSAQAVCLCNVGPWDAVVSACYDDLTVLGQYYASSLSSHGLLGLCSTYGLGPTWPASVLASITATATTATTTETSIVTINNSTGSATGNSTYSATGNPTQSATHSATHSATQSTSSALGSFSLARPSFLVWLLPWLLAL